MTLKDQLDALLDATAFDSAGIKIGAVRQVYVDDASGKLTFATVSTGIFSSDAVVPLHGARLLDDELHLDHTRSVIRDSPRPDHTEDALTPEQEVKLLEFYGIDAPVRGREAASSAPASPGKKTTEKKPETAPEPKAPADQALEDKTQSDTARGDGTPVGAPGPGKRTGSQADTKTTSATTTSSPARDATGDRTADKPGPAPSAAGRSGAGKPDPTKPGASKPEATGEGTSKSGATQSGDSASDAGSAADGPASDDRTS